MTRHWAAHATFSLAAKVFSSALLHPQDVLGGICHRASCKPGGVSKDCWVSHMEKKGSQPSLWFIGHRCSVSAPVDASSSNHHFSSTSGLTPSIANILIQTPFLLFLVVKPIFNISNHKQTNTPIHYVSSHLI